MLWVNEKQDEKREGKREVCNDSPFLLFLSMHSYTYVEEQVPVYLPSTHAPNIFLPYRYISSLSLPFLCFLSYVTQGQDSLCIKDRPFYGEFIAGH